MTKGLIHGIYAAVLVPRDAQGEVHEASLVRQLEFLRVHGIHKFAFNGATGEYCSTSPVDLKRCLQVAKSVLSQDEEFLCGVGAGRLLDTLELGRAGIEAGAKGLLVPMPYFFPYSQQDLSVFIRTVASELSVPILLYNLPQFTSGLETTTVRVLLEECDNVVGIKDSSGSLQILRTLTNNLTDCSRILGNDAVLAQALNENLCDGVVSGVACVVPEIIQALFANRPQSAAFQSAQEKLQDLIGKLDILPVPWGLKAIAEARGIASAAYQLPVSDVRKKQISDIQRWFGEWFVGLTEWETNCMDLVDTE